jgi:hypothetical protein
MMSLHLRDDCEYGEAQCPVSGCEELLRRKEVADHVKKMHEEKSDAEGGEETELKDNQEEVHSKYPCRIPNNCLSRCIHAPMPPLDVHTQALKNQVITSSHVHTNLLNGSLPPPIQPRYPC